MEISVDDFVGVLEEADTLSVRPVYLCLPKVNDFLVLEELGSVESGLSSQNKGRTVFDNQ